MGRLLILSGRKQSGKSSTAAFLHGYILRKMGLIDRFHMDPKTGELLVPNDTIDSAGNVVPKWGVFDVFRRDEEFTAYAERYIWSHVKAYSYADFLKETAIRLFGLTFEQCYGTNEQKNSLTSLKTKDILFALDKEEKLEAKTLGEYLTARKFLQYFGTNICRRLFGDCWVIECLNRIRSENSELSIVCDGRFPNEIDIPHEYGAKSLRLLLNPYDDQHKSEKALDTYKGFSYELDNSCMTIYQKNDAVLDFLLKEGWV